MHERLKLCGWNGEDVVVEHANRVEGHDAKPRVSVIDHTGHGPEVVVDGRRAAILAEAGEPDGMFGVIEARVDFRAGQADAERARLRLRGMRIAVKNELVTRIPVAQRIGDTRPGDSEQEGEEQE